jgi:AcrR family transcriptional regulator
VFQTSGIDPVRGAPKYVAGVPKVVDVEARRRELSDALWRIVLRDGMHAVTVRSVAAEAGVSAGMVQHYFRTQDELIEFAMRDALEHMLERVGRIDLTRPDPEAALAAMEQVVPLDSQRRAEAEVWLAMLSRRHSGPALERQNELVDSTLASTIRAYLQMMVDAGAMSAERDVDVETARLHALIDGLSLHALSEPPMIGPDQIRAALRAHLADLTPGLGADGASADATPPDG